MENLTCKVKAESLAAILYLVAYLSILGIVVMTGFILYKEENMWLKRNAVQALGIAVIIGFTRSCLGVILPFQFNSFLINGIGIISTLIFAFAAYNAKRGKEVVIPFFSDLI